MRNDYKQWLEVQKYDANTISAQMYRCGRVEEHYTDLDVHFEKDRLAAVIQDLVYSTEDARNGRPNPSRIPLNANVTPTNIRNNLASYRNAVQRYRTFRESSYSAESSIAPTATGVREAVEAAREEIGQRIGLERDMQAALRLAIEQLEPGLSIIDDGAERSVDSGFIDITCKDTIGAIVVIELKAGPAGQRAIAQILSYMGDVTAEEEGGNVRGILVASEFDAKAKAAARMVPSLTLRKYSVRFLFSDGLA
jgi:endonuclease